MISLRLVQQGTQRETLTKFYQMPKVPLLKTKTNTYSVSEKKDKKLKPRSQRELFIEMTGDEKIIMGILKEKNSVHIDEINLKSGLSSSSVAAAILNLELQNVVLSLPGKQYQIA